MNEYLSVFLFKTHLTHLTSQSDIISVQQVVCLIDVCVQVADQQPTDSPFAFSAPLAVAPCNAKTTLATRRGVKRGVGGLGSDPAGRSFDWLDRMKRWCKSIPQT